MRTSCRRLQSRRCPGSGFTLVELLVVIAVLALLLAILAPALTSLKTQTKRILCATQQRELSKALFLYAGNNRQTFPHAGRSGWWMWDISVAQRDAIRDSGAPREVFYCPENEAQNIDTLWNFGGFCVTGYYFMIKRDSWGSGQMVNVVFGRVPEINDPGNMPIVADAIISSFMGGSVNDPNCHDFGYAKGGHAIPHTSPHMEDDGFLPAGGNCVFGDGSVRWRPLKKMTWHKGNTPYHWW